MYFEESEQWLFQGGGSWREMNQSITGYERQIKVRFLTLKNLTADRSFSGQADQNQRGRGPVSAVEM